MKVPIRELDFDLSERLVGAAVRGGKLRGHDIIRLEELRRLASMPDAIKKDRWHDVSSDDEEAMIARPEATEPRVIFYDSRRIHDDTCGRWGVYL
jgi:hypothetical protein